MSFWKNPQYNAVKVLLLVIVVGAIGTFVYFKKNTSNKTTGQVINSSTLNGGTTLAQDDLLFTETKNGTTCAISVSNASNQSVTVTGTLGANGACVPNATQSTQNAQTMAAAMGGGATVTSSPSGLGFVETKNGTTCAISVSNASNQSVTVAGTLGASGACVPNAKQATAAAATMATAMGTSAKVQ